MAGIIYVSENRLNLLDEIIYNELGIMNFKKLCAINLNNLVVAGGCDFTNTTIFAIDLSAIRDSPEDILKALETFKKMYIDCRIVIIADKEDDKSTVLSGLFDLQIYNIILSLDKANLKKAFSVGFTKEETHDIIFGRNETTEIKAEVKEKIKTEKSETKSETESSEKTEKIIANYDFKKNKPFISVGICGTQAHIGVTHFALLTVKFLRKLGFKACYLEAHKRLEIAILSEHYNVNLNKSKNLLQYDGVDIFFDYKLPQVIAENYDFYVFDFGKFGECEPTAFFTQDVKLIVGGVKAWETPHYAAVFEFLQGSRDVRFIMNHAPPAEHAEIRESMGGLEVFFADYSPYPFTDSANIEIYKEIFADFLTVEHENKSEKSAKKKLFFWR